MPFCGIGREDTRVEAAAEQLVKEAVLRYQRTSNRDTARAYIKEKGSSSASENRPFGIGCRFLFMEFAMNAMIETASGTAIQRNCVPTTREPRIETVQEHFYKEGGLCCGKERAFWCKWR